VDVVLHVFIDTNVFLSFFAFTGDDLVQLKQLVGSIKSGALKLYLTRQVVDEFARNREKIIKESIGGVVKTPLSKGLPRLMLDYPASTEFESAIANAETARNSLITAVQKDARSKSLGADKLFEALSEAAGVLPSSDKLIALAQERKARGNPPGKLDGIGDQLNWEALLEHVEKGVDLHIVSKDGDYRSMLFDDRPRQFLVDEWRDRKGGDLALHSEIKPLLKAMFPLMQLKIDKEKNAAIEQLEGSMSFMSTHYAITKLAPFIDLFTVSDVKRLAEAAVENNQVEWIAGDDDVASFFRAILPPVLDNLPNDLRENMVQLFKLEDTQPKGATQQGV